MQIDDRLRMCQDTEALITRLGRFDEILFTSIQGQKHSDADLKRMIHDTTQKLEKFPKKNRYSQEWYEKYYQKYLELKR